MSRRKSVQPDQSWSAFVDLFSNLTILLLFVLLIFMLAQFFMSLQSTHSKGKLAGLSAQITELSERVRQSEREKKALYATLSNFKEKLNDYASTLEKKDIRIADLQTSYEIIHQKAIFEQKKSQQMEQESHHLNRLVMQLEGKIIKEEKMTEAKRAQINKQMRSLQREVTKLNAALDASDEYIKEQEVQVVELSKRLNRALANKTMELHQYQSAFFKDLSQAIGDDTTVRVKGDRFVIQSEVLFWSGSAYIGKAGLKELKQVADLIQKFEKKLPANMPWIIRVDGHTDSTPIHTKEFASNWDLSAKRAVAVVKALINHGANPKRLAATGFGEHQRLTDEKTPLERKFNRRIEFHLTRP